MVIYHDENKIGIHYTRNIHLQESWQENNS